jgi:hypothetical protein
MTKKNIIRVVASIAAVGAIAGGGVAISSGASNHSSSTAAANSGTRGSPPGMGTAVTGTAAAKAKAAAVAKYPGTAEQVMKDPNGGYVVHVIKTDGTEVHVLVSAAFKVTGVQSGGPPSGGNASPSSGSPPSGSNSSS